MVVGRGLGGDVVQEWFPRFLELDFRFWRRCPVFRVRERFGVLRWRL
jgi:hypothetical protein